MNSTAFKFNRNFQLKVLGLMHQDFEFLLFSQEVIQPEFFSDRHLGWMFQVVRDHFLDFQTCIDIESFRNELDKAVEAKTVKEDDKSIYTGYINELENRITDKDYIKAEVVNFCRFQSIKSAITDNVPALLSGNKFDDIGDIVSKAVSVGANLGDIGTQFFLDIHNRIKEREKKYELAIMPTGITALDIHLNGGLRQKQLGIWMAPTSRGKSVALAHCGKRAIIGRKTVFHYTMELSEDEVSERYDSAFSTIPIRELVDKELELKNKIQRYGVRFGNTLLIKEYPAGQATVNTIKAHINMCAAQGVFPDLILVDYIDLLKAVVKRNSKREELSDITTDLRGLATEFSVPVWSATQSRRAAISMETHTEEEVGEDIGKVNIADVVLTLNQTPDEVAKEIMRIFVAKNRNGARYQTVTMRNKLERMCFYLPAKEQGDVPVG